MSRPCSPPRRAWKDRCREVPRCVEINRDIREHRAVAVTGTSRRWWGVQNLISTQVRNPTGPTSARENALEARELALEERLRYVEAMLAAKTRMEGSVSRGAASRHPWIEPRNCEPPAPGNAAGEVVAWCRAVGDCVEIKQ